MDTPILNTLDIPLDPAWELLFPESQKHIYSNTTTQIGKIFRPSRPQVVYQKEMTKNSKDIDD